MLPKTDIGIRLVDCVILPRDAMIAGYPIREVRKAFRDIGGGVFGASREGYLASAERKVRVTPRFEEERAEARTKAAERWDALVQAGLLVPLGELFQGEQRFQLTDEALSINQATLGSGYKRATATKALEGFIERCRELDEPGSIYPYRVGLAIVFGSYVRGADPVGDVDIYLRLDLKPEVKPGRRGLFDDFLKHMEAQDRSIPYWDLNWPSEQTQVFLKARSKVLSFIKGDDRHLAIALGGPHEVIYGTLPDSLPAEVVEALH